MSHDTAVDRLFADPSLQALLLALREGLDNHTQRLEHVERQVAVLNTTVAGLLDTIDRFVETRETDHTRLVDLATALGHLLLAKEP